MSEYAIMCVDDEPIILDSLVQELRAGLGDRFIYEKAVNAALALTILSEFSREKIKVIILISDWLMPGMRGDEFLSVVKNLYPEIKALMITGHADQASLDRVEKNPSVLGILIKLWDHQELMDLIRRAAAELGLEEDF